MNLTLHLTENCNMDCAYCVHEKKEVRMTEAVVDAAVDLAFSTGKTAGLCFFGGEPLLESGLIYRAIRRCMLKTIETGKPALYKMTTNGTLLTERFLENAHAVKMGIGLRADVPSGDRLRGAEEQSELRIRRREPEDQPDLPDQRASFWPLWQSYL